MARDGVAETKKELQPLVKQGVIDQKFANDFAENYGSMKYAENKETKEMYKNSMNNIKSGFRENPPKK